MPISQLSRIALLTLTLAAGLIHGCGSSGGGAPVGSDGGFCYANGTCDTGLSCLDEQCVPLGGGTGGNTAGTGGAGNEAVVAAVAACFACGESQCVDQAAACASAAGCRTVLDCTLGCAGDASCASACDVSEVTEEGIQAMSAFTSCVVTACTQECTTDIQDAINTGTGGNGSGGLGSGGTGSGGTIGSGGTLSSGGTLGSGGSGPTGPNLILNGDFSSGSTYWNAEANAGAGFFSTADGDACFYNDGDLNLAVSFGFPLSTADAFAVQAGTTYTLAYDVSGYTIDTEGVDGVAGEAKVGLAVAPWTSVASYHLEVWDFDYSSRSHTFVASTTQSTVGFVFNFAIPGFDGVDYYWVCFDNVSLRAH